MNFSDFSLDARLNKGIKDAGFETPTPIQQQAIPHILQQKDVMGLAQTGTGKTAAFALPILQQLTTGPLRRVRALIMAPTRELAEQIHESIEQLGKHTKIKSTPIYGGVSKGKQIQALKRGVEIVVACPGRLLDLAGEGQIDLSNVEILVLDEADRMCDMGFLPDIRRVLALLPKKRQNLFFSATMHKDIRDLANTMLKNPVMVQIGLIAPAKTVSHSIYPVPHDRKKNLLFSMLDQLAMGRVLVFTRTKRRARYLSRDLAKRGYNCTELQGNMSQNRRQKAIDGFRKGKFDMLVATDIAARGIDVADISHVINFDVPDTTDAYTHRIGRTGRAEETGDAITFVTPEDTAIIRSIERELGNKIDRQTLDGFDYGDFDAEAMWRNSSPSSRQRSNNNRSSQRGGGRNKSNSGNRRNNNQRQRSSRGRQKQSA